MKAKLAFTAGLATGYVVGTRVGRRGYEHLRKNARAVWKMDAVQETMQTLKESVTDGVGKLGSRVLARANGDTFVTRSATEQTGGRHGSLPDVDSDPALNDAPGQDWTDEGGALPSGTNT